MGTGQAPALTCTWCIYGPTRIHIIETNKINLNHKRIPSQLTFAMKGPDRGQYPFSIQKTVKSAVKCVHSLSTYCQVSNLTSLALPVPPPRCTSHPTPYTKPLPPRRWPSLLPVSDSCITQPFWLGTLLVPRWSSLLFPLSSLVLAPPLSSHGLGQSGPFQMPLAVLSFTSSIKLSPQPSLGVVMP